jgi:D-cysteine desulfhydrase
LAPVFQGIGTSAPEIFAKRDDLSSPLFGGNKLRTLECLFGLALARGAKRIFSTGAYGSNHAAATVLHARRAGLLPGACLFPQPWSPVAASNLRATLSAGPECVWLPHWSMLLVGMAQARRTGPPRSAFVMVPGGAIPEGAAGYVNAALELAHQIKNKDLPPPKTVVVAVGSTCTSAGLLLGFQLAARFGVAFQDARGQPCPPKLVAVRVTPWPIASAFRIVSLAARTGQWLARVSGNHRFEVSANTLGAGLQVDGRFLGRGYGEATSAGQSAMDLFAARSDLRLDSTYSAKSAAALIALASDSAAHPILYWATRTQQCLLPPMPGGLGALPSRVERFIARR